MRAIRPRNGYNVCDISFYWAFKLMQILLRIRLEPGNLEKKRLRALKRILRRNKEQLNFDLDLV